jgi:DNA (cytosine-5)-methyltransferase 1
MSDVATHTQLACIHLCSGYGGFELGFKLAGIDARTVAHVERDTYAAATLVARMAEATLDQAPIWDDLTTFDGQAWRGKVDCITAGFPCQPFSAAGKQLGVEDDRWIWPAIKRIIFDVGPSFVFLENVPQLVRGGLPFVLCDLAQLGFNAEWGLYSAAEVGAPHKRDRFWLLAHANSTGFINDSDRERNHHTAESSRDVAHSTSNQTTELGNTKSSEPDKKHRPIVWRDTASDGMREQPAVADTNSARSEGYGVTTNSQTAPLTRATSDSRSTWPPTRDGNWEQYISQGGPKPALRRSADGPPQGLADTLHLGGNGLVPAVAAAAFLELLNRHHR